MDSIYVVCITYYTDDYKHCDEVSHTLNVFKNENDANEWIRETIIDDALEDEKEYYFDSDEKKDKYLKRMDRKKKKMKKMTTDEIRNKYLSGEYITYKVNYEIKKLEIN